jgi:hypothetical protein
MFVKIENPKMYEDYLKLRRQLKDDFEQQKDKNQEQSTDLNKVFEPILNNNKEMVKEVKESLETFTNDLNNTLPTLLDNDINNEPTVINVDNIISEYLKNSSSKSNSGYSLKYNKGSKTFSIGNKEVILENDKIIFDNKEYKATNGLMELLTRKEPNKTLLTEEDIQIYGDMLKNSNAIYQGFNPENKRLNTDSSKKWKFLKEYYPELFVDTKLGKGLKKKVKRLEKLNEIILLPDDIVALSKMLKLSILSYKSGNNGEYNKINALLDELKRRKVISLSEFSQIYSDVFY